MLCRPLAPAVRLPFAVVLVLLSTADTQQVERQMHTVAEGLRCAPFLTRVTPLSNHERSLRASKTLEVYRCRCTDMFDSTKLRALATSARSCPQRWPVDKPVKSSQNLRHREGVLCQAS